MRQLLLCYFDKDFSGMSRILPRPQTALRTVGQRISRPFPDKRLPPLVMDRPEPRAPPTAKAAYNIWLNSIC